MKRIALYLGMLGLVLALVGPASAVTIGTISGTGSVTVNGSGNPTAYSFGGAFNFDNITYYPIPVETPGGTVIVNQTLKTIVGESNPTQFTFAAHSAADLIALDSYGGASPINRGNYYSWKVDNPNGSNTSLYGTAVNFIFSPIDQYHGDLTGTVTSSDGFFHWYYGYDNQPDPVHGGGMTSLALLGLSNTFLVSGTYYTPGGDISGSGSFTVNAQLSAVPLPGALVLLGAGLVRLARYSRRKRSLV
jgi:hypothetical protein